MGKTAGLIIQTAVAATIGFFTGGPAGAVLLASLTLASSLLVPSIKRPDFGFSAEAGNRTTAQTDANVPWKIVYGEARLGGATQLWETTDDNKFHHIIVVYAAHEIEEFGTIYFGDEPIHADYIDGAGNVTQGNYAGAVRIKKHLGSPTQLVDSDLDAELGIIDSTFRLQNHAYIYYKFETGIDKFPTGLPLITVEMKGKKVFDTRSSTTIWAPNVALCLREYLSNARYGRRTDTADINDTFTNSESNICDEFVSTLTVSHTVSAVDTSNDHLALTGDLCEFQTGDRVQATTTGVLPGGISLVTDYYVIIKHRQAAFLVADTVKIQLATTYANALAGNAIDLTSVGSGTHTVNKNGEPRYTCNGVIVVNKGWRPIIRDMLTAMGGTLQQENASWVMLAAVYRAPTITYDESDIREDLILSPKYSGRERFNIASGSFVSPLNHGEVQPYPVVKSGNYLAEDNGKESVGILDFPFTNRASTAQRLAAIALNQHRRQMTVKAKYKITGMQSRSGDTIMIDDDQFGWVAKTFEIMKFTLVLHQDDNNNPLIGVNLALRATDANVYTYDPFNEETATVAAPRTTLPTGLTVLPPSNLFLESGDAQLFVKEDGTVVSGIRASWTASTDAFVIGYEAQFKRSLDSTFLNFANGIEELEAFIWEVEDGANYDVRVRAKNTLGTPSAWETITDFTALGKDAKPGSPSEFTIARLADGTRRFTFDLAAAPADVRVGGGFKIRWFLGTTTDWSAMTNLHTGLLTVSPFETNELAAGTYTFAIKAVDSSENESAAATFINATIGNPRLRAALTQQTEEPIWPGTKTNCFVDNGELRSTGTEDWTDLPATWSAITTDWGNIVAQNTTISYETAEIDLGADVTFTPLVTIAATASVSLTIEAKVGTEADGGVVGSYAALLIPTVGKRYIQFKVTAVDVAAPVISAMSIIIDGEAQLEEFEDVNTATETATWFNSIAAGHFQVGSEAGDIGAISKAQITAIQNVGAGYTWELINKTSTVNGFQAAEFKLYNGSGTLTDAVVDIELKGPKT